MFSSVLICLGWFALHCGIILPHSKTFVKNNFNKNLDCVNILCYSIHKEVIPLGDKTELKDRIKSVRKKIGLNQEDFAERIGLKQQTVTAYECGNREPSNQALTAIVREFGCSEHWLRTGEGDPFPPLSVKEQIAAFFGEVEGDGPEAEATRELIEALSKMTPEFRMQFRDYCVEVAKAHSRNAK